MNFSKLIGLLELLTLILLLYVILESPEVFFTTGMIIVGIMITIEILFYGYEYFTYIRSNKFYLVKTRNNFYSLDYLLNIAAILVLLIVFILSWDKLEDNSFSANILGLMVAIRGLYFSRQKNSIRMSSEKILFDDLFNNDLFVREIKHAKIDEKQRNINLVLFDNKQKSLMLNNEFFEKEKSRLGKIVEYINKN